MSSNMGLSKGQATRNQILDAAMKLASILGLEGLTIGALAKAVGMSKSGLYAHFQAKDSLQLQVLERVRNRFVDHVLRPAFKRPRGEPRVRGVLENWVGYLDDENTQPGGSVFIAASFELDERPGALRDFMIQTQSDLMRNLEKAVRMAIEQRHFRKDLDVTGFAFRMYSFVVGYHHFHRLLHDPKSKENLIQAFEHLILDAQLTNKSDNLTLKKET